MPSISIKELREVGIHPDDFQKTLRPLRGAMRFVGEVAAAGKGVLFVGARSQSRSVIAEQASRCGMAFLGGRRYSGSLAAATHLSGRPPGAVFTLGLDRVTVTEAHELHIPVIAVVEANGDDKKVDYAIPGDVGSTGAMRLFASKIADAVVAGRRESANRTALSARLGTKERERLEALHGSLVDKKFGPGLNPREARELEVVKRALDELDSLFYEEIDAARPERKRIVPVSPAVTL